MTPVTERLEKFIEPEPNSGCWLWLGARTKNGYSELRYEGKTVSGHRLMFERERGPIPVGLSIDHLCRNRACVNPWHLEPVSQGVNVLRGDTIPARNKAKTHCLMGHAFTPDNTGLDRGRRYCRECNRAGQRLRYSRRSA